MHIQEAGRSYKKANLDVRISQCHRNQFRKMHNPHNCVASMVLYGIVPYLCFFAMTHHDKHQHIDTSLHGMVQYHMLGMFRGV